MNITTGQRNFARIHSQQLLSLIQSNRLYHWKGRQILNDLFNFSTRDFLTTLYANTQAYHDTACLTLTAIHPDGKHHTPSRHIPLNTPTQLNDALERLLQANLMGWGAYVAIGLRRTGLTRYRRGGLADIVALPAVFVDVDNPSEVTLKQLRTMQPEPSCIVFSGGGYHAYWWLDEPLTDMVLAHHLLNGLAQLTGGDSLSPAQILRLVGSHNTKLERNKALCHVIALNDKRYPIETFTPLLPQPEPKPRRPISQRQTTRQASSKTVNPDLIHAVSDTFISRGYVQRGDWLCGSCLYPENHRHNDQHHSFGFNVQTGYGNCYRCGSILLKDICNLIGVRVNLLAMFVDA